MKICEICGRSEKDTKVYGIKNKFNKILCSKHYLQMYRCGYLLNRTKYDPNEIIIYKDYAEIVLYSNHGEQKEIARAKIDLEDVERIRKYKWHLNIDYARASTSNGSVYLHRLVLNVSSKLDVDHINHNTLDNRKINIRESTTSQNLMNSIKREDCSSIYKGVTWDKSRNEWLAKITINRKTINLGRFHNERDAALAYNKKAVEIFGEFKLLNDLREE